MLIEEKRYGSDVTYSQKEMLKTLHRSCLGTDKYHGVHLIVFENTSPEDGLIWLNRKPITKAELLCFLSFQNTKTIEAI